MKPLAWMAGGVVIGFLLGGLRPRIEAMALREALAEAERSTEGRGRALGAVPGLGALMPAPAAPDVAAPAPAEEAPPAGEEPAVAAAEEPLPDEAAAPTRDIQADFRLAVDAQALRRSQSRQALIEQAELDEEELAEADAIFAEMNEALAAHADLLMEVYVTGEEPSPRDMLAITRDVTSVLDDAQADLDKLLGEERMAEVDDEAAMVWNHIDLATFGPAVERAAAAERR